MATIKVKLFASFRNGRFNEKNWDYVEGITISRILEKLNINTKDVGVLLVNSSHREKDYQLKEGDTLSIFPVIGGG
jgi:molybdopterin synthase sulfur carrier subunit